MSRTQAKKEFTVEDHVKATEGVECRKDISVIDETPVRDPTIVEGDPAYLGEAVQAADDGQDWPSWRFGY